MKEETKDKNKLKNWDTVKCKDCGYTWRASETDCFNFTCCVMCGSLKLIGYGQEPPKIKRSKTL
jgi:hypothetical protein